MSFLLLILMNSTFNGWHGGHSSGPRYLSMILPSFSILAILIYNNLNSLQKCTLWLSLIPSLILRGLILGSTPLAHDDKNLWPFLWNFMLGQPENKGFIRMSFFLVLLIILSISLFYKNKNQLLTGKK